jgi:hypothetical protein
MEPIGLYSLAQDIQPSCHPALMDTVHPTPAASNEKLAHNEVVSISSTNHCAAYIRLLGKLAGISLNHQLDTAPLSTLLSRLKQHIIRFAFDRMRSWIRGTTLLYETALLKPPFSIH